jgi:hypothetical protein
LWAQGLTVTAKEKLRSGISAVTGDESRRQFRPIIAVPALLERINPLRSGYRRQTDGRFLLEISILPGSHGSIGSISMQIIVPARLLYSQPPV